MAGDGIVKSKGNAVITQTQFLKCRSAQSQLKSFQDDEMHDGTLAPEIKAGVQVDVQGCAARYQEPDRRQYSRSDRVLVSGLGGRWAKGAKRSGQILSCVGTR